MHNSSAFRNLFQRFAKQSKQNPQYLVAATSLLPPVFSKENCEKEQAKEHARHAKLLENVSNAQNKYSSYVRGNSNSKKDDFLKVRSVRSHHINKQEPTEEEMKFFSKKGKKEEEMGEGKMVDPERKRLSVGAIDASEIQASNNKGNANLDAKSMVTFLKRTDMIDIAEHGLNAGRAESSVNRKASTTSERASRRGSFCIASVTSTRQEAFAEKMVVTEGDDEGVNHNMLLNLGIGIRCKKGLKPEAPNQDSFSFVHHEGEFRLYGVFDGHGQNGHDVSNFVREMLPKAFLSHPMRDSNTKQAMTESFANVQQWIVNERSIDAQTSGTTGTLAYWRIKENELWVAHCGDSRAMILYEKGGKPNGADLTVDHKPNLPAEKRRIEDMGGCVIFDGFYNHRVFKKGTVFPGLNMSRAFGDLIGHSVGISEQPDVRCVKLDGKHQYTAFCLASDGVWEFIDAAEAARIITSQSKGKKIDPGAAAEELAKTSWNNWMEDTCGEISDDITVVLQALDGNLPAGHPNAA